MPDIIRAVITASIDISQTKPAAESPGSTTSGRSRRFGAYNLLYQVLDSGSYPPITLPPVDLSVELAASTNDFDLTAAPAAEDLDLDVDCTDARLIAILFKCDPGNNAAGLTIGPHPSSNGYPPFGTGIIPRFYPGQRGLIFFSDTGDDDFVAGTPAVDATHKVLRIAGTAADVLECIALFGEES
jgi:hypothetical protein